MNTLVIKQLKICANINISANLESLQSDYFEDYLSEIYFDSDYIDPISDITEKILNTKKDPISIPYAVTSGSTKIGYFSIDFSNPPVEYRKMDKASCWLDSFIVSKDLQGRGYGKEILYSLPKIMMRDHSSIKHLNLTVNLKNKRALLLYQKCGFKDTGQEYHGGPAGPQAILTLLI